MRPVPKCLYRYRSLSAYTLGELVNETMWYSSPSSFNDPFDCALTIDERKFNDSVKHDIAVGIERGRISPDLSAAARVPSERERQLYLKIQRSLKEATRALGVCCFSADPQSILMWAHYANNHKGFCIQYSSTEDTLLSEEVSPVLYSTKLPSLSISDLSPENSAETVEILLRTKAACWRYEKEWRAIAPEGGRNYPARAQVAAIIFGERMPAHDRKLVRDALRRQANVQFNEAYMHENRFAVCLRTSSVA